MRFLALAIAACLLSATAHARDAEGRLDLVLSPNSAQPAFVVHGGALSVVLREEASLQLESAAGSFALSTPAAKIQRGYSVVDITIPAEVPAGTYTLAGSSGDKTDRNYRSVVVLDAPLESYRIAVLSNLRISADPERPDTDLYRTTALTNGAALVLVTGDLTASGTPEQFRLALEILNDCQAPTLVAPGTTDFASGHVSEYLGAYPLAIPFGLDGVLLCSAPRAAVGVEAGKLLLERRRIRAARWSIGAVPLLDLGLVRDQLTVLVDDPLDAAIGAPAGIATETGEASSWGTTRMYAAPAQRAALEWFTVNPQRVSLVRNR